MLPPLPPPSGSRFSVLDDTSLEHLAKVAANSGVVFRGERGPRLEQIAAIRAKDIYEGSLDAARARMAQEREGTSTSPGSGTPAPGARTDGSPLPRPSDVAQGTPIVWGSQGRPPRSGSKPLPAGKSRRVPLKGTEPPPPDNPMMWPAIISLIWNIRGFGSDGRRRQIKDYMRQENVDIVGFQETIKLDFHPAELQGLSKHKFAWNWLPASGHSGGILLGAKEDTFEFDDMDRGEFFCEHGAHS